MSNKITDELKAERRLKVAKELATKDSYEWDKLSDVMVNAYLHNADCAITERDAKVTPEKGSKENPFACPICLDATVKNGEPCPECNPMGLPKEQVSIRHAEEARREQAKKEKAEAAAKLKEEKQVEKEKALSSLKPDQYFCSKCGKVHRESSKVGEKHLPYKVIK